MLKFLLPRLYLFLFFTIFAYCIPHAIVSKVDSNDISTIFLNFIKKDISAIRINISYKFFNFEKKDIYICQA